MHSFYRRRKRIQIKANFSEMQSLNSQVNCIPAFVIYMPWPRTVNTRISALREYFNPITVQSTQNQEKTRNTKLGDNKYSYGDNLYEYEYGEYVTFVEYEDVQLYMYIVQLYCIRTFNQMCFV